MSKKKQAELDRKRAELSAHGIPRLEEDPRDFDRNGRYLYPDDPGYYENRQRFEPHGDYAEID